MLRQSLHATKSSECGLQIGIIDFDVDDDSNSKAYGMDTLQSVECVEMGELYDIEVQQEKMGSQNEDIGCDKCRKSFDCATELQCHQDEEHSTDLAEIDERFGIILSLIIIHSKYDSIYNWEYRFV